MRDFIRMKRMHFRMLYLTIRSMVLGYTQFYWGLRQIKWTLRALIGLQPRPRTKNLKGKFARGEGVEPWLKFDPPEDDEPQSIWFKWFGHHPKYEHKVKHLGLPLRKRTTRTSQ
jgi:hypothetical protein